jgi:RimJ/RimL family protein N-acetyltransferase
MRAVISESILTGEKVRLRPVEERDLSRFAGWLQDPELRRWLLLTDAPTLEDEYDWWAAKRADPDNVLWAIETADGRLAGTVELRIAPAHRRAELGIAIQDKSLWGKGLGTETVELVLAYGFVELGLNRIELTTDEGNARAIRCYEKCGFVREALLRAHRWVDGRYENTVVMAVLRRDWQERWGSRAAGRRHAG